MSDDDNTSSAPSPEAENTPAMPATPPASSEAPLPPALGDEEECVGCEPPTFIYAIGSVQVRFPSPGVEKEFAQASKSTETAKLTGEQAVHKVLMENRYLAREVCWVFSVEGVMAYILTPRDPLDLDQLLEAVGPADRRVDCDLVIGVKGPLAPPEMCNGLTLPIVVFDQIYSFDVPELIGALPKPKGLEEKPFRAAAEELFHRVQQMADNVGELDEHRALNYLAVRYPRIYDLAAEMYGEDCTLKEVEVRPSRLSGARKLFDIIFSYVNRKTDVVDKYYVRVDVTEKYPFLTNKLSPFFDR
jgi:hypothetical protein